MVWVFTYYITHKAPLQVQDWQIQYARRNGENKAMNF